jgi:hypothetical protein
VGWGDRARGQTINYLMRTNVTGSTINPTLELRMGNVSMA